MIECVFAIPGNLQAATGGYAYDRNVLDLMPDCGIAVTHLSLPESFPNPSASELTRTAQLFSRMPRDSVLLVDGLAYGVLPPSLIIEARRRTVALVHHPLACETGLSDARRAALVISERRALAQASYVIVTSPMTARILIADYDVPANRITVAIPGTQPATRSRASTEHSAKTLNFLAVGSVVPRKAYDVLVAALTRLDRHGWRLLIAGGLSVAPGTLADLRRQIAAASLDGHIVFGGNLDQVALAQAYNDAHVFIMPSLYEGYGMAVAEAMAHGLPLVTSTGGALAETAPHEAALKVVPGDIVALANALRHIIGDHALRLRLADASWRAGQTLPSWRDTAATVAQVLRRAAL